MEESQYVCNHPLNRHFRRQPTLAHGAPLVPDPHSKRIFLRALQMVFQSVTLFSYFIERADALATIPRLGRSTRNVSRRSLALATARIALCSISTMWLVQSIDLLTLELTRGNCFRGLKSVITFYSKASQTPHQQDIQVAAPPVYPLILSFFSY